MAENLAGGHPVPMNKDDLIVIGVAGRNSDNTTIRRIPGWEPSVPLERGLAETTTWIERRYSDREAGKRMMS
jgi:nucleoside-diphosphate-sugar epimerase